MKIIFMGTPHFAVPALSKLIESGMEVTAVYTKAPAPSGRGKKEQKSPIHELAEKNNIPLLTPKTLKDPVEQQKFKEFNADVALVAAYGLLLPEEILNGTKYGCLNIHPSLLPRWRGAAPIQRTVIEGDKETGVCIMQMDRGLDTGDVIAVQKYQCPKKITAGELHNVMAEMGAKLALETIKKLPDIKRIKQTEDEVLYAKKIVKEDEKINWQDSAEKIECLIRGLQPKPGAYFIHNNERIKIIEADIEDDESGKESGTIIDDSLRIACGQGILKPTKLQRQGKNPVSTADFLRGFSITSGTVLE